MKNIVILKWILVLTFIMPMITACGIKDIDKRMFVIAFGIDKNEDDEKPYSVTLKVPMPTNNKASQNAKFIYLSHSAETIGEAIHILTSHVDKNLEFSHTKFFLIGENILDQDLRKVMDIFLRRREFQQTAWITIGRPSAERVMKAMSSSDIPDINILFNRFSSIGTESSYIVSIFLFDFRRQMIERGIDPVLPIIETNDKNEVIVNKAMVIGEDEKIIELSSKYTEDYNALSNNLKSVTLKVRVVNENHDFTVLVDKLDVKYKILTSSQYERPIIHMHVDASGVIEESTERLDNAEIELYNALTSEAIRERVESFLTFIQEHDVDPLGFGLRYEASHWHKQHLADEWKNLYPDIAFEVNTSVMITSLGYIQ